MIKKICCLLFLFSWAALFSNTIRLYNDSPYKLRCVVRGADGTYLNEFIILPEHFNVWTSSYGTFGTQPTFSQTPYSVSWYCLNGDNFSICTQVATGAMVTAEGCDGTKICKPPPPKTPVYPPTPENEMLNEDNALKQQIEELEKQQWELQQKQEKLQEEQKKLQEQEQQQKKGG